MPKNLPWIDGSFMRSPTYLFVMFSKTRNWKFLFDFWKSIKNKNKNGTRGFLNSEKFQKTGIWGFFCFLFLCFWKSKKLTKGNKLYFSGQVKSWYVVGLVCPLWCQGQLKVMKLTEYFHHWKMTPKINK